MTDAARLRAWAEQQLEGTDALFADGFDDAIVGIGERCGQETVVVYDVARCIRSLEAQGLEHDEAAEYFYLNVAGAWVGPTTPLFLVRPPVPDIVLDDDEDDEDDEDDDKPAEPKPPGRFDAVFDGLTEWLELVDQESEATRKARGAN